jgi:hypothetical protein
MAMTAAPRISQQQSRSRSAQGDRQKDTVLRSEGGRQEFDRQSADEDAKSAAARHQEAEFAPHDRDDGASRRMKD